MKLIKLGAAALNQTPLDWEGNRRNIINAIKAAVAENVNILCLPELCISGYGCEDSFFMPSVLEEAWQSLLKIREFIKNYQAIDEKFLLSVGAPVVWNGAIYNCTIFIRGGSEHYSKGIISIVPKKNLCSDGVHYESRWFKAWDLGDDEYADIYTEEYNNITISDEPIELGDVKVGVEICEDAWVADRPGIKLYKGGVDVIVNPSASHFSFGKNKIRQRFVEEGSRAFKCAYVYANLLGNESGRVIFDGDTYIASGGKVVSKGNRFSFKELELTTAVIDVDKNRAAKYQIGSHKPAPIGEYTRRRLEGGFGDFKKESGNLYPIDQVLYGQNYDLDSDCDSFTRAVSLGLWDYMRKSHSKGFVLSLSGGADSAAVACLVRSMVICAYNEFGKDFWNKLFEIGVITPAQRDCPPKGSLESFIKKCTGELLTCVYQGTKNSSAETNKAAYNLAESIGAKFHSINVQPMVDDYIQATENMLGRELTWEQDDIALQNIQARVRAPSVWMMANLKGALLLSTSNRSEAAVGYATMDGDTCGGLSPIAGVSKKFLLKWLRDYNSSDTMFNGLHDVLKLKPTAELRPQEQEQTDEDDLMPYYILDKIEKMAVRDKMGPRDIFKVLNAEGEENSLRYIEKFFRLFARNQWKRERYAPSFHLDDESLDPKTFFRFPILSAGFEQELNQLREEMMKKALD